MPTTMEICQTLVTLSPLTIFATNFFSPSSDADGKNVAWRPASGIYGFVWLVLVGLIAMAAMLLDVKDESLRYLYLFMILMVVILCNMWRLWTQQVCCTRSSEERMDRYSSDSGRSQQVEGHLVQTVQVRWELCASD